LKGRKEGTRKQPKRVEQGSVSADEKSRVFSQGTKWEKKDFREHSKKEKLRRVYARFYDLGGESFCPVDLSVFLYELERRQGVVDDARKHPLF